MKKEFIPYNLALELKELGFDEPCFGYYENGVFIFWYDSIQDDELILNCTAPTFSQAFRWFREKYMLYHYINPLGYNMCLGLVGELGKLQSCNVPDYGNYKEAELACLEKLIEIVKNK